MNKSFTLKEVSDILNVSVPYVKKIFKSGELKSLNIADVMEYKVRIDKERDKALDELSEMLQDMGFYDE